MAQFVCMQCEIKAAADMTERGGNVEGEKINVNRFYSSSSRRIRCICEGHKHKQYEKPKIVYKGLCNSACEFY